ncbi:MAG: AMIN domain-containing protein [Halieaceae bacterium]|jgi:hypothetical protein|nr:AMIN domain-containing protein [Halieaceae bacterium]
MSSLLHKAATRRAALLVLLTGSAAVDAAVDVYGVALAAGEDLSSVSIALSAHSDYRVFLLSSPERLVVDISDARLHSGYSDPEGALPAPVTALRHGIQQGGRVRLVLDLDRPVIFSHRLARSASGEDSIEVALAERGALQTDDVATPIGTRMSPAGEGTPGPAGLSAEAAASDNTGVATARVAQSSADPASAGGPVAHPSDTSSESSGSLVFGSSDPADDAQPAAEPERRWTPELQRGLVEGGVLYDDEYSTGSNLHLQFIGTLTGELNDHFELRLGGRFDGHFQAGDAPDYDLSELDYDETWLRYRAGDWRLTLGGQRIIWGRTDEISPTDRLSTRDFTRFILDDLPHRRRANPAARLEWFGDDLSVDLVYLPRFREAELPGDNSIWSPIDAERGAIAGLRLDPQESSVLQGAVLENYVSGDGGGGVRIKRFGDRVDYAITLQRVRNPEPYFALKSQGPAGPVLETVYPRTWVAGGDVGVAVANWTFRFEGAWLSDQAYTDSDFVQRTTDAVNWVFGGEVFPGDRDLRLTLQLAGTHLIDADNPIDRENIVALTGELEGPFAGNRWRAQLRWWAGLNRNDVYVNPEIVFTGWEPSELYLGLNIFDGERGTLGDFYGRNDMIVIGWRGRF